MSILGLSNVGLGTAVAIIFAGVAAFYTGMVARYTKKLWKVAQKSYFAETLTRYLYEQYYDRIKKWPSVYPAWTEFLDWSFPPPDEEKPRVFKDICYRVTLEELFPNIQEVGQAVLKRLQKEGFEFTRK